MTHSPLQAKNRWAVRNYYYYYWCCCCCCCCCCCYCYICTFM